MLLFTVIAWLTFWGTYAFCSQPSGEILDHPQQLDVLYLVGTNALLSIPAYILLNYIKLSSIQLGFISSFIVLVLGTELWFYFSHRLLHSRYLYPYHKIHHLYTEPTAVTALYCHGFEFIFCNFLSVVWTQMFIDYPWYILLMWYSLTAFNTTRSHQLVDGYHYIHHGNSKKNFGVLGIFDHLMGTYQAAK